MKVLWVTTFPPRRCGIGDYAADLALRLSRTQDLELRIVTYPDGMAEGVSKETGFVVSRRLREEATRGVIAAEIDSFRPDLVHLQSSSFLHVPSVNAALVEACDAPLVTTVHDTPGSWRAFRIVRALRNVYMKSSRLLVHSSAVRHLLTSFHSVDDRKIIELPHGVDLDTYSPRASNPGVLQKYGLQGREFVLFFGFVRPGKGLEVLLRAWSKIESAFPQTVLVVAGGMPTDARRYNLLLRNEAEYPTRLRKLATRLGISSRLTFTGYVPGPLVPGLLSSSKVVVLPYVGEVHQSGPLHKSLASGRAIIATDGGGFRELVTNGKDGVLVPPGDPAPLADAIKALLDDPAKAEELGRHAREKAEEGLGWSVAADRTLSIYRQLT